MGCQLHFSLQGTGISARLARHAVVGGVQGYIGSEGIALGRAN